MRKYSKSQMDSRTGNNFIKTYEHFLCAKNKVSFDVL
jgi:hypothetical protein